ncbi:cupin domain-containing protein [Streptomyces sp. NPDC052727]|uniref:JmjC domain-containing protein n=1 Tax=unclassified Streptomyces TaxID=2593676 RepID=UPI00342C5C84
MSEAPVLGQWVGDTDVFFEKYWRRLPQRFTPEGGASSPFALTDVDQALATGFFREPYIEMWADDNRLPARKFTASRTVARAEPGGFADPAKIRALLDAGATLLLRCIDQWHAPTRALLRALAGELGLAVEAFYFVTPAGRAGLPLHRDDADVLVVQVAGSKRWSVHEGPADGHWHAGRVAGHEPQPAEVLTAVTHPGDVLYIPRGFAHRAHGQDGLSAHLSLTVREIGVADLSCGLQRVALGDTGSALPPLPVTEEAITAAAAALLEGARRRLAAMDPQDLVAWARRARLDAMPTPPADLSLTALAASLTA